MLLIYKIDLIATGMSSHERSLLFISAISDAQSVLNLTKSGPWEAGSIIKNVVKVLCH